MSRRRRAAALSLAASGGLAAVLMLGADAQAQEPNVVAWWNSANLGDPAPAPPTPPDVKDGDLLVQGSNAAPVQAPVGGAPAGARSGGGAPQGTDRADARRDGLDLEPH